MSVRKQMFVLWETTNDDQNVKLFELHDQSNIYNSNTLMVTKKHRFVLVQI